MNKTSKLGRWAHRVLTAYVGRNEAHILTMMSATNANAQGIVIDWKRIARR